MVIAYHVIFGVYGFWLPNDPRGSWSDFVRDWEVFRAGGHATTTTTRRSVARRAHDRAARLRTKSALKYPPVVLDGRQAACAGAGFAEAVATSGFAVHACSILPEHVHLVLGRHHYRVESVVRLLKSQASNRLTRDGRHPMARWPRPDGTLRSLWADGSWKVFLDEPADVARAIRYVEGNPAKERKRPQRWSFVTPFSPGSENRAGVARGRNVRYSGRDAPPGSPNRG